MISINWYNNEIYIPRTDMTLVQLTPIEIRSLDLNEFRLNLKKIESSEDGATHLKTHNHNTEVSLGGFTFARIIEILDPYTITFEDGRYAVNLIGANSNVGDKVNVNQVSVRSQNSAGLISSPLIEYAAFEGGIWYDENNGAEGTVFPIGTHLKPAKYLSDVKLIADYRGLNIIYIIGNANIQGDINFERFVFEGQTNVNNVLTIHPDVNVTNAVFRDLSINGTLDGGNEVINCTINNIQYVNGYIHSCGLIGTILLNGDKDSIISDCITIDPYNSPIIDFIGYDKNLSMPNFSGLLTIKNSKNNNFIGIGIVAGSVVLDSSVTNGTVYISGIGTLNDENGVSIDTGIWNGGVNIINNTMNRPNISRAVWDEPLTSHDKTGTTGKAMLVSPYNNKIYVCVSSGQPGTTYPVGTTYHKSNNMDDVDIISNKINIKNYVIEDYIDILHDYYETTFIGFLGNAYDVINLNGFHYNECVFENIQITGNLTGEKLTFRNCYIKDVNGISGNIYGCFLEGNIIIENGKTLSGTELVIEGDNTIIDLGNNPSSVVSIDVNSGLITFINAVEGNLIELNIKGGEIILEPSIIGASFYAEGIGNLIDNSTSLDIIGNELISLESIPISIWDEPLSKHLLPGTTGNALTTASSGGVDINLLVDGIWNEPIEQHNNIGSFGNVVAENLNELTTIQTSLYNLDVQIKRILGLSQENFRIMNHSYVNDNLSSATVKIYNSSHDCDIDFNPLSTYSMVALYDATGKLIDYKVTKD